jgi:hypothetical protein
MKQRTQPWRAVVLGCAGWLTFACLPPNPGDWTGGFEGLYQGDAESDASTTENGTNSRTTTESSGTAVQILSGVDPMTGWVLGVGGCPAVSVRVTPTGLELGSEDGCESVRGTTRTTVTFESLVVTRAGPTAIQVEAEYRTVEGDETTTTKLSFEGTRVDTE